MNTYFGDNIKFLRTQKNMTQQTLADFLAVSFQAVSKWERGDTFPDITMLPAIASFFGVTTDWLLGIDKLDSEAKIGQLIRDYYSLWQVGHFDELRIILKQAMREYPGDYRLSVRYLNVLTVGSGDNALISCTETKPPPYTTTYARTVQLTASAYGL